MEKIRKMLFIFGMAVFALGMFSVNAVAQEGDVVIGMRKTMVGVYDDKGNVVFQPQKKDIDGASYEHINAHGLNLLCSGDEPKTVIIPSGSVVEIDYTVRIGDNTTLIADGATIIQTTDGRGVLSSNVDKVNYGSLKNVKIQGGTWKSAKNKKAASMMRFAHGQNLVIDGATVITNYEGHAVELIAMKNTIVQNCTLKAVGKSRKNSVEEALQIDIATPKTAPGVAKEFGTKYTTGQTCKNISILNNTISGSRGVCANFASVEPKYKNKFHDGITIIGNKLTGKSAEGLALFNTLNATVKNNVIVSNSTRKSEAYSVGFNVAVMGKAPSGIKKAKVTVQNNTIKGGRQGMQIITKTSSKYGAAVIKGNKLYASAGKKSALFVSKKAVSKIKQSKNKLYKR